MTTNTLYNCANDDIEDYEEIYRGQYFDTDITFSLILPDKTIETEVSAQRFLIDYPEFLEEIEKSNFAVYHNVKFTFFKWIVWVKDNSIRLILQNYNESEVKTEFDVIFDKDWLRHFSQNLIKSMKENADADLKRYKKSIKEKYGNI